jgi:hypothetical protein
MIRFAISILFSFLISVSAASAKDPAEIQRLLKQLGYNIGIVDGVIGRKSLAALENFYANKGQKFDGAVSENELTDLLAESKKKSPFPLAPVAALRGVGIKTASLYLTGKETTSSKFIKNVRAAEKLGFDFITITGCIDQLVGKPCRTKYQSIENLKNYTSRVLDETSLHVVLTFHSYHKREDSNDSHFGYALENTDKTKEDFVELWRGLARHYKDVPANRLSFDLLSEPEFRYPKTSRSKRDEWLRTASAAIEAIREISPDRTIIIEGIGLSAFDRRLSKNPSQFKHKGIDTLIKKLPYDNLVYGFSTYEPAWLTKQEFKEVGKAYNKSVAKTIDQGASTLIRWAKRNNVPVMLVEAGMVGYSDGKSDGPSSVQDRAFWASDIKRNYIDNGIGVGIWSLEKNKTIFLRGKDEACKNSKCSLWIPKSRKPDASYLKALGL